MKYTNTVSGLLYDSIWSDNDKTSILLLKKFFVKYNNILAGTTVEHLSTFENEYKLIKEFAYKVFKSKEFGRELRFKDVAKELKKIRKEL